MLMPDLRMKGQVFPDEKASRRLYFWFQPWLTEVLQSLQWNRRNSGQGRFGHEVGVGDWHQLRWLLFQFSRKNFRSSLPHPFFD